MRPPLPSFLLLLLAVSLHLSSAFLPQASHLLQQGQPWQQRRAPKTVGAAADGDVRASVCWLLVVVVWAACVALLVIDRSTDAWLSCIPRWRPWRGRSG